MYLYIYTSSIYIYIPLSFPRSLVLALSSCSHGYDVSLRPSRCLSIHMRPSLLIPPISRSRSLCFYKRAYSKYIVIVRRVSVCELFATYLALFSCLFVCCALSMLGIGLKLLHMFVLFSVRCLALPFAFFLALPCLGLPI